MPNLADDYVTIALVAVIALLIGLLIGAGVASISGLWERKRERRHESDELLRVMREARTHRLYLEIDRELYESVDGLSVGQYRRLEQILNELVLWLGFRASDGTADTDAHPPVATPMNVQAIEPPATISLEVDHEAQHLTVETVKSLPSQTTLASLSSMNGSPQLKALRESEENVKGRRLPVLFGPLIRAFRRGSIDETETTKSLIEQIDAILQEKIQTSAWHQTDIHLMEKPDRKLVVVIGDHEYDGIDQVPEQQVRALIRDSVITWEKRQDESIRRY